MTNAMWATLAISVLMLVSALAAWREAIHAAKDAQAARYETLRVARLLGTGQPTMRLPIRQGPIPPAGGGPR